jgi:chloramphenicol O-acetyltransferase type A
MLEEESKSAALIQCSALPWFAFTSFSHARNYSTGDSVPKICFGRIFNEGKKKKMPVSVHVHHALADGYHVGKYFEEFQNLLNK